MKAVAFSEHGGPDVLSVVDWPDPVPAPGQVVVRVEACALNHLDIFVRRGMPGVAIELPHISGGDVAGTVAQVGPGVDDVSPGQRVLVDPHVEVTPGEHGALGEHAKGGLCEYLAVPADNLIELPPDVDFNQAAALPIAYGTAHRMLFTRGGVSRGEVVVVLGASGGVGTACVQLAKMCGATLIAVASSDEKLERLSALGADLGVKARGGEYGAEVWSLTNKTGADVIVDCTGAATWAASIRSLRAGGRILTCGATSGYEAVTDLRYVWVREETIIGSNGWRRADLETLLALVQDARISPIIDRVVPLEDVAAAEEAIERREVFGKVVVAPHAR